MSSTRLWRQPIAKKLLSGLNGYSEVTIQGVTLNEALLSSRRVIAPWIVVMWLAHLAAGPGGRPARPR
eukprot:3948222-Lingulodinium_polyedra.AAC.1